MNHNSIIEESYQLKMHQMHVGCRNADQIHKLVGWLNMHNFWLELIVCLPTVRNSPLLMFGPRTCHSKFGPTWRMWLPHFLQPGQLSRAVTVVQIKEDRTSSNLRSFHILVEEHDPLKYWLKSLLLKRVF